jgi:uncharacterized membrane protein
MMQTFSSNEAIKIGWGFMKKHFWFFVGLMVITWMIQLLATGIANSFKDKILVFYIVLTLAAWVIDFIVRMGIIKITLDIFDKDKGKLNDLFSCAHLLWRFILASIIYFFIVLGGFILLIVPGIIWGIKYQYYTYLIIDKNMKPMEAIKKSGEITAGNKWNLFVFGLLLSLINLLGFICLFIGLFATIPATMMATVYVYRKLMGEVAVAVETPAPIATTPTPQPTV